MAKDTRKRQETFLNKTSGQKESNTVLGEFIESRANPEHSYADPRNPIRTSPEPRQGKRPTAGATRRFERDNGLRKNLLERFVGWVDRTIAEPLANWVSAGEPEDPETIANLQRQLSEAGQYSGPIDGAANEEFVGLIRRMEAG